MATTPTLSSPGLGSGLDVTSIVGSLMKIERLPIDRIDAYTAKYQEQISAYGKIKSALSTFQDAAKALTKGLDMKATSGNEDAFTVSATSVAKTGNYSVEIKHLADYNKATSTTGYEKTHAFDAGKLTISLGEFDDHGIAPASRNGSNWSFTSSSSIEVDFEGGTLAELRDAINDQAGSLVRAQIVHGADGDYLSISSLEKGRSNAMQISGTDDLAAFSYDITQGGNGNMRETSISWSTEALVDGVAVRSNSNEITGALSGITIKALKVTDEPTTLSVGQDMDSITEKLQKFVKDYNSLISTINQTTTYNAETKTASTLTGDSAVRSISSQLRNAISSVPAELSGIDSRWLADLGISINRSGVMSLDTSKLSAALEKSPADVSQMLSAYGKQISDVIGRQVDDGGTLAIRTKGIEGIIKDYGRRKEALENRMVDVEARYNKQFQLLDTVMSDMQSKSSYLMQQLASLAR